jgi:hypothetical protein
MQVRHLLAVLTQQVRSNRLALELIFLITTVLMVPVFAIHCCTGIGFRHLTRDPAAVMSRWIHEPTPVAEHFVCFGFLSQAGIFLWSAAAFVCLFTALVLHQRKVERKERLVPFFTVAGIFTLALGIDDCFMMHDDIYPTLGIPEKLVMIMYMLILVFFIIRFWRVILGSPFILLGVALFFFGFSVLMDMIFGSQWYVLEDGTKVVGIVSWMVYFWSTALLFLHEPAQS